MKMTDISAIYLSVLFKCLFNEVNILNKYTVRALALYECVYRAPISCKEVGLVFSSS